MKELSKEFIEIGGTEYTLFLNRKGVVAFEKYVREEKKELEDIQKEARKFDNNTDVDINENTNPFEDEEVENAEKFLSKTEEVNKNLYIKLYWIMLFTEHKLSIDKVKNLYEQACSEYGEEQIKALGDQMVEDVNINKFDTNNNLKNLKALRPKK